MHALVSALLARSLVREVQVTPKNPGYRLFAISNLLCVLQVPLVTLRSHMISPSTVKLRYLRRWEREHHWVCDSLLLVGCLFMSFHCQRQVSDYEYFAGPPD